MGRSLRHSILRAAGLCLLVGWALACDPLQLPGDLDGAPPETGPEAGAGLDGAPDRSVADQGPLDRGAPTPDQGPDAAVITCAVSPTEVRVGPFAPLVLAGPPGAEIRRWTWAVEAAPPGARPQLAEFFDDQGGLRPDVVETPEITFVGDRVGAYTVALSVWGPGGVSLCPPLRVTIEVAAPEGLYAELTWTSPFDPCATCDAGVDLDLVLATPAADACFGRQSPTAVRAGQAADWPPLDSPAGDPRGLAISDDGLGVEAVQVRDAPRDQAYAVAVWVYDAKIGTGQPGPEAEWPSDAVLSVFVDGVRLGEYGARLTTTGEVQRLVDVTPCVGAACVPAVTVRGVAGVWGTCP